MKVNGFLNTETAKPRSNGAHLPLNSNRIGHDLIGDNHVATSLETPMREDAFLLSDEQKMVLIEDKFRDIMNILGLDLNDDSLNGTPHRVAKMFVKEIFYQPCHYHPVFPDHRGWIGNAYPVIVPVGF